MTASIRSTGRKRPWVFRDLPAVPAVAVRLMSVLTRDDWRTREIVELLNVEQALVVEILGSANKDRPEAERYDSVEQAAAALGSSRLHAICLADMLKQMLGARRSSTLLQDCWRHSLAVARVSRCLAPEFEIDPTQAYTAGLLHNVGLLALLDFYSPEYRDLLAVSDPDPPSILEAERKLFDINHCEAGTWLCGYWNLPSTIEAVVGHHHDQEPKRGSRLALVVASAQAVGSGSSSPY